MLAVVGRVRTKNVVDVRVEFPGAISEMLVDEGAEVSRGQLLALVRSVSQHAALAAAQADIRVFQAQLIFAQQDFERIEALSQKGLVAKELLNQA